LIQSSPATPGIERDAANFDIGSPAAGTKRAIDVDMEYKDHDAPSNKQSKTTSEPQRDAFAAMDDLASADTRKKISMLFLSWNCFILLVYFRPRRGK
jgi:hypothetical protein